MAEIDEMYEIPDGFSVETDKGFSPVRFIGKTVPYQVYEIFTLSGLSLKCADNHILFSGGVPVFAKDLKAGQSIETDFGTDTVSQIMIYDTYIPMYDIQVESNEHRYYANKILSHNSIFLSNEASHFVGIGKNVLFLTCEMSAKKVIKRIGSNILDIEISEYDEISRNGNLMRSKIETAKKRAGIPFGKLFIKEYPTSTLTVSEIETLVMQTEKTYGFKIHVLIVDYLNILCDQKSVRGGAENTNIVLKHLTEDLRAVAVRQNLICITATQTRRDGFDSPNLEVTSTAEGISIVYTADLILGIIQTQEQKDNKEYQLKIGKIREGAGKNSRMQLTIDYSHMRILDTGVAVDENGQTISTPVSAATRHTRLIKPNYNFDNQRTIFDCEENSDNNLNEEDFQDSKIPWQ